LAGEPVVVLLTAVVALARVVSALTTPGTAGPPRRSVLLGLAAAALVATAVAAPQIAATAQILPDSSRQRNPLPFVVAAGTPPPPPPATGPRSPPSSPPAPRPPRSASASR